MRHSRVNVRSSVLQLATKLADPSTRQSASDELAVMLGGETLLVFVRDPEIGQLLTAPGFPQTLPNGREWRAFLKECVERGRHVGAVELRDQIGKLPAIGVAESDVLVVVIVGTSEEVEELKELRALMPLLAAALRGEQQATIASAQAQLASESAEHAESLVRALHRAQMQLQDVNAQLRVQAEDLEAQAVELEHQTEALLQANLELREAQETADRANRAKSEFLSTMSHELRTPLNAIGGYVQLLQIGVHGPMNQAQLGSLERIARSHNHLLRLINDILSLARIEAGRTIYEITDVVLNSAITDIVTMIEPQLHEKNLTLSFKMPDTELTVRADREKLDQIILNLLSNAVKFTSEGGITVSIGPSSEFTNKAFIAFADTGRGIPADKLENVFEPFVQVETGTKRNYEGSGLGLAISKDLAEGMGGSLSVESKLGEGSIFTLMLPLIKVAEQITQPIG